jgi:hypothetical protein
MSRGGSALVPVAAALVLAVATGSGTPRLRAPSPRGWTLGTAVGLFLLGAGIIYGTTISPSPRDGLQPLAFFDEAYYSVLSADLASTGRESIFSPSGFDALAGLPDQTWYHWAELWLGAAVIQATGISPMHARHLVVLPLLLLASATLAGSLIRRLARRESTEFFLLGAFAMLFIAPIPVSLGAAFDWWARGLVFSITVYGLAVVVALLGLYAIVVRPNGERPWSNALMIGAIAGAGIATHIAIAAVAVVAVAAMASSFVLRTRSIGTLWATAVSERRVVVAVVTTSVATIGWGIATGHGLGATGSVAGVGSFEPTWQRAVLFAALGGGTLLAAPILLPFMRRQPAILIGLMIGATAATLAGALAWGARLADFNTFHLFYGAIAVVLTPISVAAALTAIDAARRRDWSHLASLGLVVVLLQTAIGIGTVGFRLYSFGPGAYAPVPLQALDAIRALPPGSKMAYACAEFENFAFWDGGLIAIDAHAGVPMVPMCFQADAQRPLLGQEADVNVPSVFFEHAPQQSLYPDATSKPTTAEVHRFLLANGVDYIYSDGAHPNTLIPDATPVYSRGDITIFKVS